jgi:hypothetical protein
MSDDFIPARREATTVLVGLAGPSGGGKTFSALRLATGLAGDKKVAVVDTEARRALHYADQFTFDHMDMRPPFRPERFSAIVERAEKAGYGALVFDSFSHEHDGEGGLIDWAEEIERVGDGKSKGGIKSPGNWAAPKAAHKRMVQHHFLQARLHLIFAMRADEKIKITKVPQPNGYEKTVVEHVGWTPICEKRFMFEMTASFLFLPDRPGYPVPTKLQEQHRPLFPLDQPISEETGRRLAAWAAGKAIATTEGEMRELVRIIGADGTVTFTTSILSEAVKAYQAAERVAPDYVPRANLSALKVMAEHADGKLRDQLQARITKLEAAEGAAE